MKLNAVPVTLSIVFLLGLAVVFTNATRAPKSRIAYQKKSLPSAATAKAEYRAYLKDVENIELDSTELVERHEAFLGLLGSYIAQKQQHTDCGELRRELPELETSYYKLAQSNDGPKYCLGTKDIVNLMIHLHSL